MRYAQTSKTVTHTAKRIHLATDFVVGTLAHHALDVIHLFQFIIIAGTRVDHLSVCRRGHTPVKYHATQHAKPIMQAHFICYDAKAVALAVDETRSTSWYLDPPRPRRHPFISVQYIHRYTSRSSVCMSSKVNPSQTGCRSRGLPAGPCHALAATSRPHALRRASPSIRAERDFSAAQW